MGQTSKGRPSLSEREVRVLHVAGARPNFMKVAPVMAAVETWNARSQPTTAVGSSGAPVRFAQTLVHTGQHYDVGLSDVFFQQLGLPAPDYHLGVGSGSH